MNVLGSEGSRQVRLLEVLPVANGLGECVLWDAQASHLLWTDVPGKRLYLWDTVTRSMSYREFDEDLCSFALVEGSDDLLCAFQSGLAFVERHTGTVDWFHRVEDPGIRLNDGRVDRQGRFWFGSLVDTEGAQIDAASGGLYRVDADGSISQHLSGVHISNSICWSPNARTMYFADTPLREIYAFDFDGVQGAISNQRVFARTPAPCGPDGSTVDAEGYLWNAEWGNGRVVRYAPDGAADFVLRLPVSHPTCVTLGGEDLSTLYVTTATYGLTARQREAEPQAGHVFCFETPFRGLPECRFIDSMRP